MKFFIPRSSFFPPPAEGRVMTQTADPSRKRTNMQPHDVFGGSALALYKSADVKEINTCGRESVG